MSKEACPLSLPWDENISLPHKYFEGKYITEYKILSYHSEGAYLKTLDTLNFTVQVQYGALEHFFKQEYICNIDSTYFYSSKITEQIPVFLLQNFQF